MENFYVTFDATDSQLRIGLSTLPYHWSEQYSIVIGVIIVAIILSIFVVLAIMVCVRKHK